MISDALGLSVIHTHRVYRELAKDGLIDVEKGEIRLLDLEGLEKLGNYNLEQFQSHWVVA